MADNPVNDNAKVQDLQKKRELSEAASELDDNKAFQQAILDLRKHWFNQLMTAALTTEAKLELIAQIKALELLPVQLKLYIKNYREDLKRQQRHG
jgi:hypothetical protein